MPARKAHHCLIRMKLYYFYTIQFHDSVVAQGDWCLIQTCKGEELRRPPRVEIMYGERAYFQCQDPWQP
jgi:hypothetical protein